MNIKKKQLKAAFFILLPARKGFLFRGKTKINDLP